MQYMSCCFCLLCGVVCPSVYFCLCVFANSGSPVRPSAFVCNVNVPAEQRKIDPLGCLTKVVDVVVVVERMMSLGVVAADTIFMVNHV